MSEASSTWTRRSRSTNDFASALDGTPYRIEQADDQDDETWSQLGSRVPLRELARRSIVRSGNLATNLLLERVGAGSVADLLNECGCSGTTMLPRGIGDEKARDGGLDNLVTARDLGLIMLAIANRTVGADTVGAEAERVLAGQEHRDKIPAGLPLGTYVANKTGWTTAVSHDVALVRPEQAPPYVLVVCTTTSVAEEQADELVASVSRSVWEAWGTQEAQERGDTRAQDGLTG